MSYRSETIKSKYFLSNKKDIDENYANNLIMLLDNVNLPKNGKELISFVKDANDFGISKISNSSSSYLYYDEETGKTQPYNELKEYLAEFLSLKYRSLNMIKDLTTEEKAMVLNFVGLTIKDELDEKEIESIVNYNTFDFASTDIQVKETFFKSGNTKLDKIKQATKTVLETLEHSFKRDENIYLNRKNNSFGFAKVNYDGIDLYVPLMKYGYYMLNNRYFIQAHEVTDYINDRPTSIKPIVSKVFDFFRKIKRYYKFRNEDLKDFSNSIQLEILNIFYGNINRYVSDYEIEEVFFQTGQEMTREEADQYSWTFKPFIDVTEEVIDAGEKTPLNIKNQRILSQYKIYYREYKKLDKIDGSKILNNLGKSGYDTLKDFKLKRIDTNIFDPSVSNNTANFLLAYNNDNSVSLLEQHMPWAPFNYRGVRNTIGMFSMLKAYEISSRPDKPLTITGKETYDIPGYNMWFLLGNYTDTSGRSTYDGMRLLHKYELSRGFRTGMKFLQGPLDKGIGAFMQDDLFFMHNGVKYPLNVKSSVDMIKRENYGTIIEALYNGKKALEGNLQQEVRDFTKKPLDSEKELLKPVEVFRKKPNGVIESIGKHFVGYIHMYLVHETDTNYNNTSNEDFEYSEYVIGVEAVNRVSIMGAHKVLEDLIGTEDEIEKRISDAKFSSKKLHGKHGAILKSIKSNKIGFIATAIANSGLAFDEARILLRKEDVKYFLKDIRRALGLKKGCSQDIIDKYNDIKEKLYAGETIKLFGLQLRNPSIDDANYIPVKIEVRIVDSLEYDVSVVEVNPITWARQGGDFDGDQATLLFVNEDIYPEYVKLFGVQTQFNLKHPGGAFEFKAARLLGVNELNIEERQDLIIKESQQYNDLKSFLEWNSKLKGAKAVEEIVALSWEKVAYNSAIVPLTTLVSKRLIGVAKTVTMKPLMIIDAAINENLHIESTQLRKDLIENVNKMNNQLVQPTIDIQKWDNNLIGIIKLILIVYKMNQVISFVLETLLCNAYSFRTKKLIESKGNGKTFDKYYDIYKEQVKEYKDKFFDSVVFLLDDSKLKECIELVNPDGELFKSIKEEVDELVSRVDVEGLIG